MTSIRVVLLALLLPALAGAADITALEYYIDTDPGLGLALQIPMSSGATVSAEFQVNLNTVTEGTHYLFVRAKDVNNHWSINRALPFYKTSLSSRLLTEEITDLEYFIDLDPGLGLASPVPVTSGLNISETFVVNLSGLGPGTHNLYVRVRDNGGLWSIARARPFYNFKSTLSSQLPANPVTTMEYYIDSDPGPGAATSVPITAGLSIQATFTADFSALLPGTHYLYSRVQDQAGAWSVPRTRPFYIISAASLAVPDVTRVEYFFDTDPGYGNGHAFLFGPATSVMGNVVADISGLAVGSHTLEVRALGSDGIWSPIYTANFDVHADADGDGIDDNWELTYAPASTPAGQELTVFSATGDYDDDGYSDYQEYLNREETDSLGAAFNPTVKNAPDGPGYEGKTVFLPAIYKLLFW